MVKGVIQLILKKWVVPVLVTVGISLFGVTWWHGHHTGKTGERQVQELKTAQSLLRAAQEAERIREHDIKLIMEARDRETKIIETIRTIRVDVPTPECVDLGDEWLRQYNNVIEAANQREPVN